MVIDAATDQPDCHLKGKICHFSCEGCAEKEPPIHQCTPEFGGGPPKRLYHTAAGGRKLQSEYVRSYPVTQVCKHGYDATREKKQKNNVPAAAQQPAEKRPRRRLGGVATPKQSEKQGTPTTQVRRRQQQQKAAKAPPPPEAKECSARLHGSGGCDTHIFPWASRAMEIPVHEDFTMQVGDLICTKCRSKLRRQISGFRRNEATEELSKEPTARSNKEYWMDFGATPAAHAFNSVIAESFPEFEVPPALFVPWLRVLACFDLEQSDLGTGKKAETLAKAVFCQQGYSFLGSIMGRGKVIRTDGVTNHVVFNGLQTRLAQIMALGNTDRHFQALQEVGLTISRRGVTQKLTLLVADWVAHMKLVAGSVLAWMDNLEVLCWKENFGSTVKRVVHAIEGGGDCARRRTEANGLQMQPHGSVRQRHLHLPREGPRVLTQDVLLPVRPRHRQGRHREPARALDEQHGGEESGGPCNGEVEVQSDFGGQSGRRGKKLQAVHVHSR